MKRMMTLAVLALVLGALYVPRGEAAYKSLQRDGSANPDTAAKVLVAPSREDYALTIRRIRITNAASSTRPSYRFVAKRTTTREGQTESLASCSLPGCLHILTAEGLQEGALFDYTDLNITLDPGERLMFFASADISSESEYATIEVWYDESPMRLGR